MTTTIVTKLRYMARQYTNGQAARGGNPPTKHYLDEAADEIERLQSALAAHEAPEPVAWRYRYHPNGEWHLADESAKGSLAMAGVGDTFEEQPLYTRGTK